MLLKTETLSIYFGNSADGVYASDEQRTWWSQQPNILDLPPFAPLKNSLGVQHLAFDHQVHGCSGRVVTTHSIENFRSWTHDGDYLVTQKAHIGIGILTADCLPIILHDPVNNAIAVIHAGWRGSVKQIAIKALETMHTSFNTQARYIKVFFGPCIGPCCYIVGTEVITALGNTANYVVENRNENLYFSLRAYNELLLHERGVPQKAFNSTYNTCTLCNDLYCSHRKNRTPYRQMTVASLKNDSNNH